MTCLALLLLPLVAAQAPIVAPASERSEMVVLARVEFRKGNFRDAIDKLEQARTAGDLKDPSDLFEAALIQGLSHFYLNEGAETRRRFVDVLLYNPDYDLDPLVYGDEVKQELDAVRASPELKERLDRRREELREAKRRAEEARRLLEEAERKRRELAAIPERIPTVQRHNLLVNFLPFGVPQIEQERVTPGVLFAVAQGVSLTATVLTYTQVQSLIESDGKVARDNLSKAVGWRWGNWVSVGVAAAVYVGGVVDAFLHYRERTLTTIPREEYLLIRDADKPAAPASPPAPYPKPEATLFLAPLPGGGAAGVVGRF